MHFGGAFLARCEQFLQKHTKLNVRYFARNGLWVSLRFALISLFGALVTISFARFSTPEILGQYQFVISLLALMSFFALPGLSMALLEAHAKGHVGAMRRATCLSFLWSLLGVPFIVCFGLYKMLMQQEAALGLALVVAACLFPLYYAVVNKWYPLYENRGNFALIAKRFILAHGIVGAALIGAIMLSAPLVVLIAIFFLGYTLFHFVYYRRTLKDIPADATDDLDIRYSVFTSVQKLFYTSTVYVPPFAIGLFYGYERLAEFHIAFFFVGTFALFFASLSMLYMPLLFKYAKIMLKESVIQNVVIGIVGAAALALCVGILFVPLFGTAYESMRTLALTFCGIALIVPLRYFLVNYYTSRKKNLLVISAYASANIIAFGVFFLLRGEPFVTSVATYLYLLHTLIFLPLLVHYVWHAWQRRTSL